jgi:hypothetical protein
MRAMRALWAVLLAVMTGAGVEGACVLWQRLGGTRLFTTEAVLLRCLGRQVRKAGSRGSMLRQVAAKVSSSFRPLPQSGAHVM